jgi:hypothetical protein
MNLEAARLAEKFADFDFDDIDAILESHDRDQEEKKVGKMEELDDDQLDNIIASVVSKK